MSHLPKQLNTSTSPLLLPAIPPHPTPCLVSEELPREEVLGTSEIRQLQAAILSGGVLKAAWNFPFNMFLQTMSKSHEYERMSMYICMSLLYPISLYTFI